MSQPITKECRSMILSVMTFQGNTDIWNLETETKGYKIYLRKGMNGAFSCCYAL